MGTKEYHKTYYELNKLKWKVYNYPEKHNRLAREYYHKHKTMLNPKKRQWDEDNFEWVLWSSCRRRARYEDLNFQLDVSDIIIPKVCPYLNILLTRTQGEGVVWSNASVDRIDNSKGYTNDNIMIISRMANSMKQHATKEQLLTFAKNVLKLHDE